MEYIVVETGDMFREDGTPIYSADYRYVNRNGVIHPGTRARAVSDSNSDGALFMWTGDSWAHEVEPASTIPGSIVTTTNATSQVVTQAGTTGTYTIGIDPYRRRPATTTESNAPATSVTYNGESYTGGGSFFSQSGTGVYQERDRLYRQDYIPNYYGTSNTYTQDDTGLVVLDAIIKMSTQDVVITTRESNRLMSEDLIKIGSREYYISRIQLEPDAKMTMTLIAMENSVDKLTLSELRGHIYKLPKTPVNP